jgi:hypothetical protein
MLTRWKNREDNSSCKVNKNIVKVVLCRLNVGQKRYRRHAPVLQRASLAINDSLTYRRFHSILELAGVRYVPGQGDNNQSVLGRYPEVSAGHSSPAGLSTGTFPVSGPHGEAEPESLPGASGDTFRKLVGGHHVERFRAEESLSVELALIEEHLAEVSPIRETKKHLPFWER